MNLTYTKKDDLNGIVSGEIKVDLTPFTGKWKNTKSNSGQIPFLEIKEDNGQLFLHAYGATDEGLKDWGEVRCAVYTDGVNSDCANAFITKYTFDNIDVEISSNVKLGVLVVQTYTIFKDDSKRYNYYAREFYSPASK